MRERGILAVVSGFSGAGKGTLMKALMDRYDNYALSISVTTRQPREGEKDGREYFFITEEQFDEMVAQDRLIEYARYVHHSYGTPKDYVMRQLEEGKDVILEIEIQGALKVKEKFPEAVLVFVMPPSAGELKRRLIGRGTEPLSIIDARLKRAAEEAVGIEKYDYIIVNDDVNECAARLHALIQSQHCRASENLEFIEKIRQEMHQF